MTRKPAKPRAVAPRRPGAIWVPMDDCGYPLVGWVTWTDPRAKTTMYGDPWIKYIPAPARPARRRKAKR